MIRHEHCSSSRTVVCILCLACGAQPPSASAFASQGSGSNCTASLFQVLSLHSTRARPRSPSHALADTAFPNKTLEYSMYQQGLDYSSSGINRRGGNNPTWP